MQPVFSCSFLAVVHCDAVRSSWAIFRWRRGKLACLHAGVETGLSRAWLQTAAAAMRAARQASAGPMPLVLALSAPQVLLKQIKAPLVDPAQRARIIRFEVEQNLPFAASEVIWDFVVAGRSEVNEDLLLAVAKRDVIASLCEAARRENFKVRLILPSALATRAAEELVRPTNDDRLLVLNIGGASATLLQVHGQAFAVRSWLLEGGANVAPAVAAEVLVRRLVQETVRSLTYFQRQNDLKAPTRMVLAGGATQQPGLAEQLRASLQVAVQALEVAPALEPAAGPAAVGAGLPELPDLVGAAILHLLPGQVTANLLPPALRRRAHLRQRRPWLLAAGLLVLAAPVPPLIQYHRLNAALRNDLPAMEKILAPLRAYEAGNRTNLGQLALLRQQVMQLQAVQERRDAWLRLFADLQERLVTVEDVWFEKLQTIPAASNAPMKLAVSGRMLDKANPLAKVSPETFTRLKVLLADMVDSPFVAAVESERFDNSQPGILKFDLVLVTDPAHPL